MSVDGPAHPLADSSLAADTSKEELIAPADGNAQDGTEAGNANGNDSVDVNLTPTNSVRRVSGMLSPPLAETRRKQKQREEGWGSPIVGQQPRRPTRPAPAPAPMLDLPTIEDMKAIQAAELANDGKSHSVQFDSHRSFGNLGLRDLTAKRSTANGIGSPTAGQPEREESVELESVDNRIVGQRGRARGLGLVDAEGTAKALGGMSLIDASSTPGSPVVRGGGEAEVPVAIA